MNIYILEREEKKTKQQMACISFFSLKDKKKHYVFVFFKACAIGTFKSTINDNHRCDPCPLNSYTKDKGASSCTCNDGFFRLNASVFNSPCIGKLSNIINKLLKIFNFLINRKSY
jgi:hypothetical protein